MPSAQPLALPTELLGNNFEVVSIIYKLIFSQMKNEENNS